MTARPEARLEREFLLAATAPDVALFRSETGVGFRGALAGELCAPCAALARKHRLTYGLGVGGPDIVGAVAGRFVGLELKSHTGRIRPEQLEWHAAAARRGVFCRFVRSVDEGLAALEECRNG